MPDGIKITINADTADAAAKFQEFFGGLEEHIQAFVGFTKFAGAAAMAGMFVEGMHKLGEFIEHVADAEEGLGKLGQKTGLAIETISGLQRVAYVSGEAMETLNTTLGIFADKVFVAAREGGQVAQTFRDLGIRLTEANGALRPTDELLAGVAEKFRTMPDGPMKTAAAMDLFGRSGREMIPILNEGAEGIRRLGEAGGIKPEQVEQATKFGEAVREMKLASGDLGRALVDQLLPAFTGLAKLVTEVMHDLSGLSPIATALGVGFKVLAGGATVVAGAIEVLGIALGRLGAALYETVRGHFGLAAQIIADMTDVIDAKVEEIKIKLADIYAPLENPPKPKPISSPLEYSQESKNKLAEAQAATGLKILEADLRLRSAREKAAYDDGLITLQEYTKRRKQILQEGLEALQDVAAQQAERINKLLETSPTGSKERAELLGQREQLIAEARSREQQVQEQILQVDREAASARRQLEQEVERQYAEAVKGKLDLLKVEEAEEKKKIDRTVADHTKAEEEKAKVTEIYTAKRKEILKQEAAAQYEIELAAIQGRRQLLEKDPDLTAAQKKERLLELLREENALLEKNIALNQLRVADMSLSPEAHLATVKQLQEQQNQHAGLQQQISTTSAQGTFSGEFHRTLTELGNEWGSWAQQAADTFKTVFESAIHSISDGITGLIMGTKTWAQALMDIGRTILTTIIQAIIAMGVRWVLTQLMMATMGKALQASSVAASAPMAALAAALWATPATLATIASYGTAAAMAPEEILLAQGMVMTQSLAAFEKGGRPQVGQLSLVGEKGPELFVADRPGTIIPAHETAAMLRSRNGRGGGSGGAGGTKHSTTNLNVGVFHDQRMFEDWARSQEGRAVMVDIWKQHAHEMT